MADLRITSCLDGHTHEIVDLVEVELGFDLSKLVGQEFKAHLKVRANLGLKVFQGGFFERKISFEKSFIEESEERVFFRGGSVVDLTGKFELF